MENKLTMSGTSLAGARGRVAMYTQYEANTRIYNAEWETHSETAIGKAEIRKEKEKKNTADESGHRRRDEKGLSYPVNKAALDSGATRK